MTLAKRGRPKKTANDSAIEERIAGAGRGSIQEIVYLGELVENTLKGEFGAIIKCLTAGRVSEELNKSKDGKLSADRILGRLEMAESLWNDLEQFVLDKDRLLAENRENTQNVQLVSSPE
jgi:hypothetical protein